MIPASGPRPASTAIYYLITSDRVSAPYRVASDEIWHFYLLTISPEGDLEVARLGMDFRGGATEARARRLLAGDQGR
ncbi:MAG TPA: hypothetical protein EYP61_00420 [Candidatus Latescibacteria bacterium]|nr:hypothetical protein [Candidatus Latescibacterota bacterium]